MTDHAGHVTRHTYHPPDHPSAGLPWTTTNPENEETESLYNTRGQLTETTGNGTYRVTYHYNDFGERDQMRTYRTTTSAGDLTQWTHDPATGLLLEKTDAAGKKTTYTYHSSGRLHTRRWARSGEVTTTYTHNPFGDLTGITYSDDTHAVTITPDRLGRPSQQITDGSGTRVLTYHPVTGGLDLVSYGASGPLASLAVDYTWDASIRPAGYTVSGGGPVSVLGYDTNARLSTVDSYGITHTHGYIPGTGTLANLTTSGAGGTILTRTLYHDRMGRLFGIVTANATGAALSRHGYTLDAAGRRTRAIRENGQRWDYGYDDVGQVTTGVKKFPNGAPIPGHTFAYEYDGIGNRTSATHGGTNTAVTYTPNALNQYDEIDTEGGRFILGEAPLPPPPENAVIINGDTANPAERAGGLGFYWKLITGTNSLGPLWSTDTVESGGVTITGQAWTPAASVTPEYDFDGNLTNDGRWDYLWDAENRLICMTTTPTLPPLAFPASAWTLSMTARAGGFQRPSPPPPTAPPGLSPPTAASSTTAGTSSPNTVPPRRPPPPSPMKHPTSGA